MPSRAWTGSPGGTDGWNRQVPGHKAGRASPRSAPSRRARANPRTVEAARERTAGSRWPHPHAAGPTAGATGRTDGRKWMPVPTCCGSGVTRLGHFIQGLDRGKARCLAVGECVPHHGSERAQPRTSGRPRVAMMNSRLSVSLTLRAGAPAMVMLPSGNELFTTLLAPMAVLSPITISPNNLAPGPM